MIKKLFFIYLFLLHIVLMIFLFVIGSYFFHSIDNDTTTKGHTNKFQQRMLGLHKRMEGNVPSHATIFFGDSLVQGLCVSAITPFSVNYGIGFDTTANLLERLPEYTSSISKADLVVISVGINDLDYFSDADIIHNYKKILQQLPTNRKILINAIMPVNEYITGKSINERIKKINRSLEVLSSEKSNIFYLDVGSYLSDSEGNLLEKYQDDDGYHLNSEGNAVIINRLRISIQKIRNHNLLSE